MSDKVSFYGHTLPNNCVDYRCQESKRRLLRSMNNGTAVPFLSLSSCYNTQREPAFCGLSTLAIILNTMRIDPRRLWKTPWRWYTEELLGADSLGEIREVGIIMEEFQKLAHHNGAACQLIRPDDNKESYEAFRNTLLHVCTGGKELKTGNDPLTKFDQDEKVGVNEEEPHVFMAISYCRKALCQLGKGHYSPIAAFDLETDSGLVFDTARFKYPPFWAPVDQLFRSMLPVDEDTGKGRGYFLLSQSNNDGTDA